MASKKQKATTEDIKWDEHLEMLIDAFEPFLLDTLRVSHLLCMIDIQEVRDKAASIHKKENEGYFKDASAELLEAIKSSDQPGKWQIFIDALREAENEYEVILDTLLSERRFTNEWLSDQANRNLIQIFSKSIETSLELNSLLDKMFEKGLILTEDQQLLRTLIHEGKKRHANAVLLLLMHRQSSSWYQIFMGILCDDDYHFDLANKIDPEFCKKRKEIACAASSMDEGPPGQSLARGSLAASATSKEMTEMPSLGGNLAGRLSAMEKMVSTKSLPSSGCDHSKEDEQAPQVMNVKAACNCQCCAEVLSKVTSLESELAEMKALLRYLVKAETLDVGGGGGNDKEKNSWGDETLPNTSPGCG